MSTIEASTPEQVPPGRVQRRRERQRERMLDVAEQLFSAHPYAAVRIDAVAEQADVAVGTVYTHFGNKDELFLSVTERVLDRAIGDVTKAVEAAGDHSVDVILATGTACLELLIDQPAFARFLLTAAIPDQSAVRDRVRDQVKLFYDMLADVLRRGIASGDLEPVNADELATFLISSWCGVILAAENPLVPPATTAAARTTIAQAQSVLLRGLLRPGRGA